VAPRLWLHSERGQMIVDDLRALPSSPSAPARSGWCRRRRPLASSREERRALLREANLALVTQVRGYYARPWAVGDAEDVTRSFVCECGATDCVDDLERPVGFAAAGPVLAAGHGVREP
jgi:hypothetical protein